MRVIIAGGSGMIGRELSSALTKDGDEITILSRTPAKVTGLSGSIKVLAWDGRTTEDWASEVDKADGIINLTGENLSGKGVFPSRWTRDRKRRLVQSRVDSGKALTEAIGLAKNKPFVFIQASGVGFYGINNQKTLSEKDLGGNDFSANLCREWEASSQPVEEMGVRRVITRNGVVLSTQGGALIPLLLQYRLFAGGPLGSGKQVYSWIHIFDEVSAIRFLLKNSHASGVYNLTSPYPVTNYEFGMAIGKVMKRPHYFKIPAFVMKIAFGEVATMVLEGQEVLPKRLMEAGFAFRYPLILDALTDLLKQ